MDGIQYDCIVVGGGISGISFACYLKSMGKRVLVLEQKERVGGQIHTECSTAYNGYWRELGAHTCYNSYTHLLSLVRQLDGADIIQPLGKASYMAYANREIKKLASQMSIPSILFNCPKAFFISKKCKTVKEYFTKIVGRKNYNKIFSRLFRAVICQNADEYPSELFLKHRTDRYKEFPRKYTFKEGITSFVEFLIKQSKLDVLTQKEVTKIECIKKNEVPYYNVYTSQGDVLHASSLALASDPQTTSKLLSKVETDLSGLLADIPLFYSESLNVIVAKDKLKIDHVAGIIPVFDEFLSAVSRDLIEDENLRSFTFHFEKGKKAQSEKIDVICKVLDINPQDILESSSVSHVLPSLRVRHLNMADKINLLRKNQNIYILGNYFYGLSLEDCIQRSFNEFERLKTNII